MIEMSLELFTAFMMLSAVGGILVFEMIYRDL